MKRHESLVTVALLLLGVEIDGVAKVYRLNLLNRHEVVNDRFGDRPVAAVW